MFEPFWDLQGEVKMKLCRYKLYDKITDFFMGLLMILLCIAVLGFIFGAGALCYKSIFTEMNCKVLQGVK